MSSVHIQEDNNQLLELVQRAMNGEEIIITISGKPVAKISALIESPTPRVPGVDGGKVIIHDDFDSPLPEFDL